VLSYKNNVDQDPHIVEEQQFLTKNMMKP